MARSTLIDFASDPLPSILLTSKRISHRGLTIGQFDVQATPGIWVGAPQLSLAVHDGTPYELGWKPKETQRTEHYLVSANQFHLLPPDQLVHVDWVGDLRILGIAFTTTFIERAVAEAFNGQIPYLKLMVAIENPAINELVNYLRRTMSNNSHADLLYIDHIGSALALKIHEIYGNLNSPEMVISGGLGPSRQRRALEYIESHLGEDLNLTSLSAEIGLGPHHFSRAFRASLGMSPYRYFNKRRIARAKELLTDPNRSLTDIGLSLGFSSHSHFTDTFRRITGITPSQYRKDRI